MSAPEARLILASSSPRRAALLREAGIAFEQVTPPFDDTHVALAGAPPHRAAAALAFLKAATTADLHPGRVALGADTIAVLGDQQIGKPNDREHAERLLRALFDRAHSVVSAVALVRAGEPEHVQVFHDTATVRIEAPGADDLRAYLDAGEWRGKAGGYNLAELQDRWRFEVRGDPTTVTGLPMRRLLAAWKTS